MERTATLARKTITIIHSVSRAIVIQLVLLLNSVDADQYRLVNFVSAKNVFKEESVINVALFTGI